ncbi:MAG TPA: UV damage repair protein UvrX, partial [Halanaerobiales bacterium]|nr:UV damage repair protein UvrX [Halanaerobiales bacterium]
YLEKKFGIMGSQLYYHARGVDLSRVEGHYNDRHKSMGRGITLFRDYTNPGEIKTVIFELAEEAARRARTRGMSGQTIYLGVGYSRSEKEKGFHKQQTINHYTNLTSDIYRTAESLFDQNYKGQKVRRISVALGKLSSVQGFQLDLFSDKVFETRLNQVKDLVEKRFGHNALFPGRSLCEGSIRKRIKTTIGGHGV